MQGTWQRNQTRVNLAYTLGWYQGDFDTAGLPNFAYPFLFNRQAHDGRRAAPLVLLGGQPDPVRLHALVDRDVRQPAPVRHDRRPRHQPRQHHRRRLHRRHAERAPASARRARPTTWANWYRTVDLRLARPLYSAGRPQGQRVRPRCSTCSTGTTPVVRRHAVHRDGRAGGDVRRAHGRLRGPSGAGGDAGGLVTAGRAAALSRRPPPPPSSAPSPRSPPGSAPPSSAARARHTRRRDRGGPPARSSSPERSA